MTFIKEEKYVVLKLTDIEKYLSSYEKIALHNITHIIAEGRLSNKKIPYNNYIVVNEDESYSAKVWELIKGKEV